MKLGRLLLLAGAAVAANQFLNKTEKGRQIKRDLTDNAGKWGDKLKDYVSNRNGNGSSDLFSDANPTGSSSRGSGSPL
jgi:hypothetical protein